MYPSRFGKAEEDINCRCVVLEIGRWELDEEDTYSKFDGDSGTIVSNLSNVKNYDDFREYYKAKEDYLKIVDQLGKGTPFTFKDYIRIVKSNEKKLFEHFILANKTNRIDKIIDYKLYKEVYDEVN